MVSASDRPTKTPRRPRRSRTLTDAQQRLLDEHQGDTCEYEMGQCLGGCRPACPRSYCTSERHKVTPEWPCNVAAPILGYRNAAAYWAAEDAAWLAWYEVEMARAGRESGGDR